MASEESATKRPKEEDRLDPTLMFGGESGRIPSAAEIVAQTILQLVADGKRATARKQLERDAPVLDKHEPGEGVGMDVAAIVELARETETIPNAFATPMAQLLRGTYAPEAKMDLVRAVRAQHEDARAMRAALPEVAPSITRIFGGLIDDALSLPARKSGGGRGQRWILVALLVAIVAAAAAVVYLAVLRA